MQIPHDDPRERLRGGRGVRAKQAIPAFSVLGVYAGQSLRTMQKLPELITTSLETFWLQTMGWLLPSSGSAYVSLPVPVCAFYGVLQVTQCQMSRHLSFLEPLLVGCCTSCWRGYGRGLGTS